MSKTSSRTACLQEMIKLEERKGTLEKQLSEIHARIQALTRELLGKPGKSVPAPGDDASAPAKTRSRRKSSGGRSPRGEMTGLILEELKAAGPEGVSVADLATKLDKKYANVYVWFSTTGKNNYPNIEKAGKGRFRIKE
ncbi:MAG: hypothetical protein RLZZ253_549 [Verrucomicrobiota bacterium]|jgi:hypothetical protein